MSLMPTAHAAKPAAQGTHGSLVMFTANWCANCRDVAPVLRRVALENAMALQTIDVDSAEAPAEAKRLGLSIPSKNLPQVYLFMGGTEQLIVDGARYTYGQSDMIRGRVLRALQSP